MNTARFIWRAFAVVTLCSLPAATVLAQEKPDEVVRVNTDLVQTDFMVFDKQGNFVDGLKREQFAFNVEGKPREITFFDRIAAGSRSEEAQLAAARGTNAKTGAAPLPLDRGRTVFFFIDDLHLSPSSTSYTRQMLKHFIDREMKQNDQAEIISASGQLGFLQQLTDNKAVLMGAAERLRSLALALQSIDYPPITEYQAIAVDRGDTRLLDFFIDKLIEHDGDLPRNQAAAIIRERASQIIEERGSLVTRSFSALRGFVKLAAALPGRKIVFFISDGFLLDHNRSDNDNRLQAITDAAARAGVVIYAMDARGLGAGQPEASQSQMADPSGVLSQANIGEIKATQDGLNALASDTGGRAFFNTNSMPSAVATGLKESSTYYLLAWRPETEEQRNPRFRRIEVSVIGRPDLVVRFRRGIGEPPEQIAKDKPKPEPPPVGKTASDEINSVLRAQYPATAMPVAINLNFLDTPQYGGTLTTTIKVGTSALALDAKPDGAVAAMDVAGWVLNDQGKSVSTFSKRITIKPTTKNPNNKLPENVFYNHFALVKPGLYQVRVAAMDEKTGSRGSAFEWIEIPDVGRKELTMSSLIVGERKPENEVPAVESTSDQHQPETLKQVVVNVDHRFANSSYLRFLTFIYNAAGSAAEASGAGGNAVPAGTNSKSFPDLAVQVQIFRDSEPVITTPLHKIQTEGVPDVQRVPYAADVSLDGLTAGAYVLQVTVIDRIGKTSASQRTTFQIE